MLIIIENKNEIKIYMLRRKCPKSGEIMKKIVIILGMHRSGTSVITQICQSMGVYLGKEQDLMEATQYNLSGFFENKEIIHINDEILQLCKREWYSLEPLTIDFNNQRIVEKMEHLESIVTNMFETSDMVGIKDPRMAILLPLWERIFDKLVDEVIYIWEFRNPLEVAESLKKRDGFSRKHSLLLWVNYNLNILEFLKEKEYLLVNYRDILEDSLVFHELAKLFGIEINDDLIKKLNQLVKHDYCHSDYSHQIIEPVCGRVLPELYNTLLNKKEKLADLVDWIRQYREEVARTEGRYIDNEVLERITYLKDKELVIYGAGKYGQQAAKMLQQLGASEFVFCDRDINKQGMNILGANIYSISKIEKLKNPLIIIAIGSEHLKGEIEQTLACVSQARLLSFSTLEVVWKNFVNDHI